MSFAIIFLVVLILSQAHSWLKLSAAPDSCLRRFLL